MLINGNYGILEFFSNFFQVEVNVQPLITPFPAPLDESFQLSLHEKCIALNKQHSEEVAMMKLIS